MNSVANLENVFLITIYATHTLFGQSQYYHISLLVIYILIV